MSHPKASLFVSTYEMPEHLRLVCAGLSRQSALDYEILICDDGSGPETKAVIEDFTRHAPVAVRHFWQEHQGFRKCRILNQALRDSKGSVCIFLDGDCVPHKDYVRDHLDQQEEGRFLAGRRVELGPRLSKTLTVPQIMAGFFDRPNFPLLLSSLKKDSEFFQRSIRISNGRLRKMLGMTYVADMKGCNYSVSREALVELNGFDEEYEGYGREDTDIELRLQNLGLRIKSLKGLALQFHVWHPRREFTPSNDGRLSDVKSSGRIRCTQGMLR